MSPCVTPCYIIEEEEKPMKRPKGWVEWREGQRRWAEIQARWPRRNWLQLVSDHYDYLYPEEVARRYVSDTDTHRGECSVTTGSGEKP